MIFMFDPLICLQQEISEASDDASRKYYEEIPEKDRTTAGVTEVMRTTARNKHASFKGQFSKFTAVANPKLHLVIYFVPLVYDSTVRGRCSSNACEDH
jgi:hypothetical protein